MIQPDPNSEWYQPQADVSDVQPEAPRPQKNRRTGIRVASAVVGVLALIVLSVYAFSDRLGPESTRGEPPRSSGIVDPKDFAEDFRAFFEEYYGAQAQGEPEHTGSDLRRFGVSDSVSLELVPAEGREELSLQELYRRAMPSIIGLKTSVAGEKGYFWGCALVVTEDGYIVTNQHIVDGVTDAVAVLPDGSEVEALLVGEDVATDLAVLKVQTNGLTPAELGDSAALVPGDRVAAIGNPLSDELAGTMTDGIISGAERDIQMNGRRMKLLQTNAAINQGNSGGPLLNIYGQVVGLINMKLVSPRQGASIEGIGFAIPSTVIRDVSNQLIAEGAVTGRPVLGVTLGTIPLDAQERYKLPDGLYVYSVAPGSDAQAKGLTQGDIVTHADGERVFSTQDVLRLRDAHAVGESMILTVWRDGKSFDLTVVLRDQTEIEQ